MLSNIQVRSPSSRGRASRRAAAFCLRGTITTTRLLLTINSDIQITINITINLTTRIIIVNITTIIILEGTEGVPRNGIPEHLRRSSF